MEKMTKEQLANMFDHTLLKPFATKEDFQRLCEDSKKYGFMRRLPPNAKNINVHAAVCRKNFPIGIYFIWLNY